MKRKHFLLLFVVLFIAFTINPLFSQERIEKKMDKKEEVAEKTIQIEEKVIQIEVEEIELCTDVVDRQPVGSNTEFENTTKKIYCWTKIKGGSQNNPVTIKHQWYYKDELKAEIELNIAGSPWRTWSCKTLWHTWTGDWTLKVVDEDGTVLKEVDFKVTETEIKEIKKDPEEETIDENTTEETKKEVKTIEEETSDKK